MVRVGCLKPVRSFRAHPFDPMRQNPVRDQPRPGPRRPFAPNVRLCAPPFPMVPKTRHFRSARFRHHRRTATRQARGRAPAQPQQTDHMRDRCARPLAHLARAQPADHSARTRPAGRERVSARVNYACSSRRSACARASGVISAPDSMRAISSWRPAPSSRATEVRVTVPSLDLAIR